MCILLYIITDRAEADSVDPQYTRVCRSRRTADWLRKRSGQGREPSCPKEELNMEQFGCILRMIS